MIFNSFAFAVFFPTVLVLYWLLTRRRQNALLVLASYFFYGWWNWRFLFLLAFSTCMDYALGRRIYRESQSADADAARRKRLWVTISVAANLTFLGIFKYFNFFVDSLEAALTAAGIHSSMLHLHIVLPVGISFYTFQSMSYTLDIYRGKLKPAPNLFDFAVFVSFFPQLVAGPIERGGHMLPQVLGERRLSREMFLDGLYLIFWGLFKKVYVADNLAPFVDRIFALQNPCAFEVLCGVYAFAFQIYCDFSGYSDIARGAAKCLGFDLSINFNLPYISASPREFWTRWHISLSQWLRDYLYIPLGGSRGGKAATCRNLALTMLLGGLWHGAAWKYVLWGGYQGTLLILQRLAAPFWGGGERKSPAPADSSLRRVVKIAIMFQLICVGWLFFRANSLGQIGQMLSALATLRGTADAGLLLPLMQFGGPLILMEVLQFGLLRQELGRTPLVPAWGKCALCSVVFYLLAFHGASPQTFIYFQF